MTGWTRLSLGGYIGRGGEMTDRREMSDTTTKQETETVGILKLDGESGWEAFGLDSEASARHLIEEALNLIDGSYMAGETDNLDDPPLVTIEVRRMPKGWLDSLPEHTGW